MNGTRLATFLGVFGIGLGLAQVLAPERVSRLIGLHGKDDVMRALGMREIASGIAILMQDVPRESVWARVWGDVMDLSLLNAALNAKGTEKPRVAAAAAAVAGVTALDVGCSQQLSGRAS